MIIVLKKTYSGIISWVPSSLVRSGATVCVPSLWDASHIRSELVNNVFQYNCSERECPVANFISAMCESVKINGYFIHTISPRFLSFRAAFYIPIVYDRLPPLIIVPCEPSGLRFRPVIEARSHFLSVYRHAAPKSRRLSRFNEGFLLRSMLDVI